MKLIVELNRRTILSNGLEVQYHNLIEELLESGKSVEDRTMTGTLSKFGHSLRCDLSEGFPLLTTKKINFNLVAGELLFFLQGSCDRRILQEKSYGIFNDNKHDIWKLDCEKASSLKPRQFNGYNMGEMYPEYWRKIWAPLWDKAVTIKKPIPYSTQTKTKFKVPCESGFLEKAYSKKEGLEIRVYNKRFSKSKNTSVCDIVFEGTGYCMEEVSYCKNKVYPVKDRYYPSLFGVGYLGKEVKHHFPRLYNCWRSMLRRCYHVDDPNYHCYGGKGVTVHEGWHSFENFYKDVFTLPNFQKWYHNVGDWGIDKDYYGGEVYSKTTCIFLPKGFNSKLTGDAVISPEGKIFFSLSDAEEFEGLSRRGDYHDLECLGYKYFNTDKGNTLIRPILFMDPISDLIDAIKTVKGGNPVDSRRLYVNNWNVSHNETAVLAACHTNFQCLVRDGKLNLSFSMRSSDVFLGLPYNISSYALLCHILAKLTGLEVGELVYFGNDVHLYSNHVDQAKELLSREPRDLPEIVMPEFETLEELLELTGKDFVLEGYNPHGFIKAPQAS